MILHVYVAYYIYRYIIHIQPKTRRQSEFVIFNLNIPIQFNNIALYASITIRNWISDYYAVGEGEAWAA